MCEYEINNSERAVHILSIFRIYLDECDGDTSEPHRL